MTSATTACRQTGLRTKLALLTGVEAMVGRGCKSIPDAYGSVKSPVCVHCQESQPTTLNMGIALHLL